MRVTEARVVHLPRSWTTGYTHPSLASWEIQSSQDECCHLLDVRGTFGFVSIYPTFTK